MRCEIYFQKDSTNLVYPVGSSWSLHSLLPEPVIGLNHNYDMQTPPIMTLCIDDKSPLTDEKMSDIT